MRGEQPSLESTPKSATSSTGMARAAMNTTVTTPKETERRIERGAENEPIRVR